MALDRAPTLRTDPRWLAERLADPRSRAVGAGTAGVLLSDGAQPMLLRRSLVADLDPADAVLLGLEQGAALFAVELDSLAPEARARFGDEGRIAGLRDAGAILSHREAGLAAYTAALLGWHRRHRFCSNCGAATETSEGGTSRRCPGCGGLHFPRTDPVVIVVVEHDRRVLLGRQAVWPEGQYSALAGFVAPGETVEEAVVREVEEESGIRAHTPTFVASQPWPFPSSLMLGFEAGSDGGHPVARDGELEDVRWFEISEVAAALAGDDGGLRLPPSVSIARFLVERWWRARS